MTTRSSAQSKPHEEAVSGGTSGVVVYSIPDFCKAHGFSRAMLYKLWAEGRGPRVMKIGTRTLISAEAAAEWRRRMEEDAKTGIGV